MSRGGCGSSRVAGRYDRSLVTSRDGDEVGAGDACLVGVVDDDTAIAKVGRSARHQREELVVVGDGEAGRGDIAVLAA